MFEFDSQEVTFGTLNTGKSTEANKMLLEWMRRELQREAITDLAITSALGLDLRPQEAEEVEMHGFSGRRWLRSLDIEYPEDWE